MALPAFFRPIVNWVSHQITRGLTALGVLPLAKERYPGIDSSQLENAIGLGQQSVENAVEANRLGLERQLSEALRGRQPLEDVVEVRVLVDLRDASGLTDNLSLRVTVPWGSTVGEMLDLVESVLIERLLGSPGLVVTDLNIIPPLLLGPGTGAIPEQAAT